MKANKFTLLIVDDEEDDRFFIERAFQKLGAFYRIHGLVSGNEGIAYIKGEGKYADRTEYQFPSYVITDLKMAAGDGFLLLEFIKKNPALSIIPVVMLSGSTDPDDIRTSYLLGASSYFSKPQNPPELEELVKSIHEYWARCHVPVVDEEGFAVMTDSTGKAGARFTKPTKQS